MRSYRMGLLLGLLIAAPGCAHLLPEQWNFDLPNFEHRVEQDELTGPSSTFGVLMETDALSTRIPDHKWAKGTLTPVRDEETGRRYKELAIEVDDPDMAFSAWVYYEFHGLEVYPGRGELKLYLNKSRIMRIEIKCVPPDVESVVRRGGICPSDALSYELFTPADEGNVLSRINKLKARTAAYRSWRARTMGAKRPEWKAHNAFLPRTDHAGQPILDIGRNPRIRNPRPAPTEEPEPEEEEAPVDEAEHGDDHEHGDGADDADPPTP